MGRGAADELKKMGVPFVIIDRAENRHAAFGLGIANKLLEPQIGAVLGTDEDDAHDGRLEAAEEVGRGDDTTAPGPASMRCCAGTASRASRVSIPVASPGSSVTRERFLRRSALRVSLRCSLRHVPRRGQMGLTSWPR